MVEAINLEEKKKWDAVIRSFPNYDVFYLNAYAQAFAEEEGTEPFLFYYEKNGKKAVNVIMRRDIAKDMHFRGKIPVVVSQYDRDALYLKLNEAGFGAVSLYHTMIDPIQKGDYKEAVWLSKHIINMPVHQDVTESQIQEMADMLFHLIGKTLSR